METRKTNNQILADKHLSLIARADNPLGISMILVREILIVVPVVSVYQLRQEEILKAVFG